VKFEFDSEKNTRNKIKHGIDFVEAQELWLEKRIEIEAKLGGGEIRYAVLGTIKRLHYTIIITYRGDSVRLISARRSSSKEIAIYEQAIKKN
jgi:uncharacterized DUF497 family protein